MRKTLLTSSQSKLNELEACAAFLGKRIPAIYKFINAVEKTGYETPSSNSWPPTLGCSDGNVSDPVYNALTSNEHLRNSIEEAQVLFRSACRNIDLALTSLLNADEAARKIHGIVRDLSDHNA